MNHIEDVVTQLGMTKAYAEIIQHLNEEDISDGGIDQFMALSIVVKDISKHIIDGLDQAMKELQVMEGKGG